MYVIVGSWTQYVAGRSRSRGYQIAMHNPIVYVCVFVIWVWLSAAKKFDFVVGCMCNARLDLRNFSIGFGRRSTIGTEKQVQVPIRATTGTERDAV